MSQTAADQSLLQYAADSLGPERHHTEAEGKTRREAVIDAITAFLPDDPFQTMLASEAIGFHLSIMDGFREINSLPMTRAESARARMVAVAQTKMVLSLVRELRLVRDDALATAAPVPAPTAAPEPATTSAPEPATMAEATAPIAAEDDTAFQANLAEFRSAYSQALNTLKQAHTLDPETADRANAALARAVAPALAALNVPAPGVTPTPAPLAPVTGSRAQRRAIMKQRGAFRKAS